jgi:FkbM family methyltransferase
MMLLESVVVPGSLRNLMHRFGFDVTRWPHRPDDGVLDWALDAVLRSREINCVIDVGGNRGHFAERMRTLGYRGRIVSFEPSPSTLPVITAAAARDSRWEVRPVGLSVAPGTAELQLHAGTQLDSLLTALPGVADQMPIMAETGTATVTLSTLAAEFPSLVADVDSPRVLLKSDTQGHDAAVLRGAGPGGLPPEVVAVLVELAAQPIYNDQPKMTEVMDILLDDGFTPVAFQPLFQSSDGLRMVELDGLFMRSATGLPDYGPGFLTTSASSVP